MADNSLYPLMLCAFCFLLKTLNQPHFLLQPKGPHTKGKQEKKVIHPYSRKAAQLAREGHKQDRKEK